MLVVFRVGWGDEVELVELTAGGVLLQPAASKGPSRYGSVQTAPLLSIPTQSEVVKENETVCRQRTSPMWPGFS